jgi:biotin carboxylase
MSKTIHILGAGQWQVPTIRLAKALGYRVFVTDVYRERPGYAFADEHECVDIADLDLTLRTADRHRIDGIVCDTTDVGVPTMAYVADRLGLPSIGYETALNFTNKHRMRCLTSQAGLRNPPFHLVTSPTEARRAASDVGLPVVVKPVDNQSSRGVHVVRTLEEVSVLTDDALRCSRSRQAIVEAFLDGTEVTVETFCSDGEVFVAGISDKDHFAHRPEVANRLTYPAAFPSETLNRIRDTNEKVVQTLGLKAGIAHAEYMVVGADVFLVEIAARGAGSRVHSHIVPYLAGAPVPRAYLEFIVGGRMSIRPDGKLRAANLAFFAFPSGTVRRIEGVDEAQRIPGVQEILLEFKVGDMLSLPEDDRSRPGLVVVFGTSRDEVLAATAKVFDIVRVETQ